MELSTRIRQVVGGNGDDGWSVYYRARDMMAAGKPVVMLTIGDHDIKTDGAILDAMKASMAAGNLGYSPVTGSLALRTAIAARVGAAGTVTTPDNVLVTPGGQAALYAAMIATLDAGQSCIVLDPFYATYLQTVRAASARPVIVPTRADEGFQPDIGAIEAAIAPDTRAILINTPNNPTGAVYRRDRLAALAALCRARGIWLISDEVYDIQIHAGEHVSPRDLPDMAGRCLVVNSLSKSHAMTGSRLGWVLGPEDAIARIAELATTTTYGVPGFIQDAGVFALTEGDEIERGIAARYARRRQVALDALGNGPGYRAVPPEGGMYLMLDIRETGLSGVAFAERLLDEEAIAVMPGESFGHATAGHLRIALTQPEAALGAALGRIAAFASGLVAG